MFEDGKIVDRFLDGWRQSGKQVCLPSRSSEWFASRHAPSLVYSV